MNMALGISVRGPRPPKLKMPAMKVGPYNVPTDRWLWSHYRWTPAEYKLLYEDQDGQCKICGSKSRLYVDFDQNIKKVRGLLCVRCLRVLDFSDQSTLRLLQAHRYLLKYYLKEKRRHKLFGGIEELKQFWDEVQQGKV